MIPTVGRIVHYVKSDDKDLTPKAAIITEVRLHKEFTEEQSKPWNGEEHKYLVSLHVFYNPGDSGIPPVPWSPKPRQGHWNWPPRV